MTPARAVAIVVAAVLAAYATAFAGTFQFDDFRVIVDNAAVHDWPAWRASMPGIRPLLKASYTFSWTTGGGSAAAFHALNVACHAACAILVFMLARRWTDGTLAMPSRPLGHAPLERPSATASAVPLAVALAYALHPAQTEVVTYVSGRSSGLMALFYLAAILCWERGLDASSRAWRAASLALFAAALATKETAWTLPFALVLVELARTRGAWAIALRRAGAHLALLAVAAAAILTMPGYRRMLAHAWTLRDPLANLDAQVSAVAYLVAAPLATLRLDIDPQVPVLHGLAWWAVAIALVVALVASFRATLRGALPGFGVLWFFLHLAPTHSLIARDDLANDRQLSLALVGVSLAVCAVVFARWRGRAFAAIVAVLAAGLGTATAVRNLDYRSEVALWQASLAANPRNARAWNNLGMAWRAQGDVAQAQAAFARALEIDPAHPQAQANRLDVGAPAR